MAAMTRPQISTSAGSAKGMPGFSHEVLRRFGADLIIVACGFDAGAYDPMARMMLHSEAFRAMTRRVMEVAAEGHDRLLLTHEGGYHLPSVPFLGLAVIEQLCGRQGTGRDPFVPLIEAMPYQGLQPHQDAVIRAAEQMVALVR
jgi:acetoin utilization deacetylase AcuC-like enzyme